MQKYGRDLLPASVSKDMSKEDWNSVIFFYTFYIIYFVFLKYDINLF